MATGCKECGRSDEKCICGRLCAVCGAPEYSWNKDDTVRSIKQTKNNTELIDQIATEILKTLLIRNPILEINDKYNCECIIKQSYKLATLMIKERKNHVF